MRTSSTALTISRAATGAFSTMLGSTFRSVSLMSKLVYNDHPWDPKIVAVVDRWSLFNGQLCYKTFEWGLRIVVVIDRWL
jgi:hypothetical protein